MRFFSRSVLLTAFFPLLVHAQEDELRNAFGIFGSAGLNVHQADFKSLPGVPNCCPTFGNENGFGFGGGFFYDIALGTNSFFELKADVQSNGLTLKAQEKTSMIAGSESLDGVFEHTMKSTLWSGNLGMLYGFSLAPSFQLLIGAYGGYRVKHTFEQKETIIEPATRGTFIENGLRVRNEYAGDIPETQKIIAGPSLGVRLLFPMNSSGSLFLSPQLFAGANIMTVVKSTDWRDHWLMGGLGLVFRSTPEEELPEVPIPEPKKIEIPELYAEITAMGVSENSEITANPTLRMEEFVGTSMYPLLPYVFFEEGSAALPLRYKLIGPAETETFSIQSIPEQTTIPIHHNVLNIIGQRLRENPSARITITGCNSDEGQERRNIDLSKKRAERVRAYLKDIWGIAANRMESKSRNLPLMNSSTGEADGVVENRRVEISSDTWEIMQPVTVADTFRVAAASKIKFKPTVHAKAGLAQWHVQVAIDDSVVFMQGGGSEIPEYIDWEFNLADARDMTPRDVKFLLSVQDNTGKRFVTNQQQLNIDYITVQKKRIERIADKVIDRFALILFDFDKADIKGANLQILQTIRSAIKAQSSVRIIGYTDRIGESAHNKALSERRAEEVRNNLTASNIEARGVGEEELLFDNDLPEGRTYSRTVIIEVITPVGYE